MTTEMTVISAESTVTHIATKAHGAAVAVTTGGLGVSMSDVTEVAQLIGAVTGAIAGVWALWDMWQKRTASKRRGRS